MYEEEGLEWTFTDYPDNAERIAMFEQRPTGLFSLFDEALKIPQPSDAKLAKALYEKCKERRFVPLLRA